LRRGEAALRDRAAIDRLGLPDGVDDRERNQTKAVAGPENAAARPCELKAIRRQNAAANEKALW
jgi:hypothetical protein